MMLFYRFRKRMRRYGSLLILTLAMMAVACPSLSAKELNVGIYENPPKVFTQKDGTPAGIFVDIIEEIARREQWSLRYVNGTWANGLARLESGEIDLMVDLAYSPDRAERYDFCENDVISNWAQVYTRKGLDIKLITDLAGLHLATLRGGIHLVRFKELADGFGFHFDLTQVDDYETVFRLIHEKRVDGGIVNRVYGYANEKKYNIVRSPVVFSPASLRFAVKKGTHADVVAAIDAHLASMKSEEISVYHQSLRQWLGETTKLNLPKWIGWALSAAGSGMVLLFLMSLLLKYQVNKKTAHLQMANRLLDKQVHETMKAHLELKHSEDLLIRQERLSALGQLTSGIVHDFNNMLFPILGYSDLLLEQPDELENPESVVPKLRAIRAAAITARETVKRLQEFHRADPSLKMESVNLSDLVSEVVTATKPLWKLKRQASCMPVDIIEEVPADLVATVSRPQLSEALMNLLLNALHAIADGGHITIRAFSRDGNACLEVRDTGIGMAKEVARQCLEPFFSTKGENGTGMGLAMVHGIVKRHNGTLHIDSVPDEGTTITIQIPLVQEEEPGVVVSTGDTARIERSLKLLVVDDDENSRRLLEEYLVLDGHTVISAKDGASAMEMFDRIEVDMVLTDSAMPKKRGDELARHVKSAARRVPVLMITGFYQIMGPQGEPPEGVDVVMGKPFTLRELRVALSQTYRTGIERGQRHG